MVLYNLTQLTSATDIGGVAMAANNASNGILFGFFFVALFFIMVISMYKTDFELRLLSAGFVCFILSSMATYGGFLDIIFALGFFIIMALSGAFVWAIKN